MATQKTTKTSEQGENVKQAKGKVKGEGRLRLNELDITGLDNILSFTDKVMRHWQIKWYTYVVFISIAAHWCKYNKGCSLTTVSKLKNGRGNEYNVLAQRVGSLVDKGILEIVGKGRYNCNLYCPTPSAMIVVDAFLNVMSKKARNNFIEDALPNRSATAA